jgi:hypothetical protein
MVPSDSVRVSVFPECGAYADSRGVYTLEEPGVQLRPTSGSQAPEGLRVRRSRDKQMTFSENLKQLPRPDIALNQPTRELLRCPDPFTSVSTGVKLLRSTGENCTLEAPTCRRLL